MSKKDFYVRQGDDLPALSLRLRRGDHSQPDITGATIRFHMATLSYENVIAADAEIADVEDSRVRYRWQPGDTDNPGRHFAEFEVTYPDGGIETFPNDRDGLYIIITRQLDPQED